MAQEVETTELPPEPARRNNTLLIIVVVIIGLFLLCCCLLLLLFAIGWLWTYGDTLLDISQLIAQFAA